MTKLHIYQKGDLSAENILVSKLTFAEQFIKNAPSLAECYELDDNKEGWKGYMDLAHISCIGDTIYPNLKDLPMQEVRVDLHTFKRLIAALDENDCDEVVLQFRQITEDGKIGKKGDAAPLIICDGDHRVYCCLAPRIEDPGDDVDQDLFYDEPEEDNEN